MRLRRSVLLLLTLCGLGAVQAQEALRPAVRTELWTAAVVQGRLPKFMKDVLGKSYKRVRMRNELGYRSADVFFAGRQTYLDVNLRYKLSSLVDVAYEHRFAIRPDQAGLQHRNIWQAEVGKSFGRWEPGYRFIYQHSYVEWGKQREVFRNRFQVGYKFKNWKLDPQLGVEFFTWASNKGMSYFGTRWSLGTAYNIGKAHSIGLTLLNDRERDVAWPTRRWIWSFTYALNLRDL
ncbi:MAG: DUF2490 domain-containing protein [Flavobacteriales bacterium]|nr:DUF2490 domain-containing protein [Flavobacteriales bacterium]